VATDIDARTFTPHSATTMSILFDDRQGSKSSTGNFQINPVSTPSIFEAEGVRFIGLDRGQGYSLEHAISVSERAGRRGYNLDLMKDVVPKLKDIRLLVEPDSRIAAYIEQDEGEGLSTAWPASSAGDGVKRLLLMACIAPGEVGSLVLVEDPEAFQHQRSVRQVVKLLRAVSKKSQVVVTTHSPDLIRALVADINGTENDDVAVYHLEPGGTGPAKRHSGTQAQVFIKSDKLRESLGFV
jgi:hypothetical protein